MKKLLIIFALFPSFVFAQALETGKGIQFEHTPFSEILAKAKKENKLIMMDAYTTWCGPCKWMAKNIFTNDTAAEFYNKNFVNAKIDMEKGEGIELAKKYQVSCYPTFLFIDGNGQLVHRLSGSMETQKFIELGMNSLDPAKQYASHQKKYDSGTATADETAEYLLMRGRTCLPVKDEMAKYFATQADADLIKQRNWDVFSENSNGVDIGSREFKYLVAHKGEFDKLYKVEAVDGVVKKAYYSTLNSSIKEKNNEKYNAVKKEIQKNNFPFGEEMILSSDMALYKSNKDWNNYAQSASAYIEKFKKEDHNTLNNVAWAFYENVEDKALLAKAEGWIRHSVELKPGYFNYDTYASVLYKLGKKAEAKRVAEQAIVLAKQSGDDYKGTQELLDKINLLK